MSMNGVNIMITQKLIKKVLKMADPILQDYIRNLIEENSQLKMEQTKSIKEKVNFKIKISELKIENQTYKQRISTLQKALDKTKSNGGGDIILNVVPPSRTKIKMT
jgi:regulator of replication initiation timing